MLNYLQQILFILLCYFVTEISGGPFTSIDKLYKPNMDNNMPSKVWEVITYLFPSFNGVTIEVWE